jgi:hypothetical protein
MSGDTVKVVETFLCPLEQVRVKRCPVHSCLYHTKTTESGCMIEELGDIPVDEDLSEADVRVFKNMTREGVKSERLRGTRWIKRGFTILKICEWMATKPKSWYHLSRVYKSKKVRKVTAQLAEFPWSITDCKWTPGKILMVLRQSTWEQWEKETGNKVTEPHLRILRLTPEVVEQINKVYENAYHKLIAQTGRTNSTKQRSIK